MKHITSKLLLVLIVLVTLTSCWDRTEIKDLTIIVGCGIDKTEEGLIEVSAELVVAAELGDPAAGGLEIQKQTIVRKGTGKTLADAMDDLDRQIPRRVFWGHTSIFVISEKIAKAGLSDHIDFIIRHSEPRMQAYVFVSGLPPADILSLLPPVEGRIAKVLQKLADFELGLPVDVKELSQMLRGESGAAILPYITKLQPEKESEGGPLETIAIINGSAIFKDDKMVKRIDQETTEGVMWVRNAIQNIFLTISLEEENGFISISIPESKVNLIPEIKNGVWKMTVQIKSEAEIVQNTTNLNMKNPDFIDQVSAGAEKEIETKINRALNEVQDIKADVLGFAEAFHRKYTKQWAKEQENWDETFAEIEVDFDINIKIARQGMSNPPAGIPEDEVKEE